MFKSLSMWNNIFLFLKVVTLCRSSYSERNKAKWSVTLMSYNNKLYYYNYETAVRGRVQIFKQEGQGSQTVLQ